MYKTICALVVVATLFLPSVSLANESVSITVTPPLFQLTVEPGQMWKSSLKVVNTNDSELVVYPLVMDFAADGERGQGKFIPIVTGFDEPSYSLAQWITLDDEMIKIRAGGSAQVRFTVEVPLDAEPGGHYAAILVGNKPEKNTDSGPSVAVSTYVSSLFFLRVSGEVVEAGDIREFVSNESVYDEPNVDFRIRFQNIGNVHLLPQGDVTIYNMWGKERGKIEINQETFFGNVLPDSARSFEFSWLGDGSPMEIGKYKAVATLTFGEDAKQNTTATTYFWIVPFVPLATTLGIIGVLVFFIVFSIRRYIRRALALERERAGYYESNNMPPLAGHPQVPDQTKAVSGNEAPLFGSQKPRKIQQQAEPTTIGKQGTIQTLTEPLRVGALDLRNVALSEQQLPENIVQTVTEPGRPTTFWEFLIKYKMFFLFLFAVVAFIGMLIFYIKEATMVQRDYDIYVADKEGVKVHVVNKTDSEEHEESKAKEKDMESAMLPRKDVEIIVINASAKEGFENQITEQLSGLGFENVKVKAEDAIDGGENYLYYRGVMKDYAIEISEVIGKYRLKESNGLSTDIEIHTAK